MMLDILHKLLKRVVGGIHMLQCLKNIVGVKFKEPRVKAGAMRSLHQANGTVLLDERFCCLPSYPTLKIFKEYGEVKQWDGSEYWAAFCQLVTVVALLLIKDDPTVLQCVQAVIHFVHMAQYKLHSNQMLHYVMSHYPDWIKLYESAIGFTTCIAEAMHINWIKDFIKRTNLRKCYKKQILDHNVEKFNLMVRANLDMFFSAKTLTQADRNAAL